MLNDTLTAIEGIRVGHAVLPNGCSGCTVVLPEDGAIAGVDVRGGAPGTYGTDALNPVNLVETVHGIFFSGGSAFGLSVADGVRDYLVEGNQGFTTAYGVVPIVAGAIIFDFPLNHSPQRLPDRELGYQACLSASSAPVEEGCAGAGAGATVGKIFGDSRAMKAGIGSTCIEAARGVKVGALVVVNALGNIVDPFSGRALAGCRISEQSREILDADAQMERFPGLMGFSEPNATVVGCVVTNAKLSKTQLTKVAQMSQDGLARTIYPAHTMLDGDTMFALSCGASGRDRSDHSGSAGCTRHCSSGGQGGSESPFPSLLSRCFQSLKRCGAGEPDFLCGKIRGNPRGDSPRGRNPSQEDHPLAIP